jgi:hypothetical protein
MNPLLEYYYLACSYVENNGFVCTGKMRLVEAPSVGLKLGDLVPPDPSDYRRARCPRCQRCKMKVVGVPEQTAPAPPEGFTKIPTE